MIPEDAAHLIDRMIANGFIQGYQAEACHALIADWRKRGEALEPLSGYPEFCDINEWDDDAEVYAMNGVTKLLELTLKDFRRARSALTPSQPSAA